MPVDTSEPRLIRPSQASCALSECLGHPPGSRSENAGEQFLDRGHRHHIWRACGHPGRRLRRGGRPVGTTHLSSEAREHAQTGVTNVQPSDTWFREPGFAPAPLPEHLVTAG